jgi:hypothetical protein
VKGGEFGSRGGVSVDVAVEVVEMGLRGR